MFCAILSMHILSRRTAIGGLRPCRSIILQSCGRRSRYFHTARPLGLSNEFLKVSEEVQEAVSTGKPVVALESTIYTHGMLSEKAVFHSQQAKHF